MLGPFVLWIADIIAAFSEQGYNPIRDSISSLALAPMGWLQTIGFLVIGLLVEVFVLGLYSVFVEEGALGLVWGSLFVLALGCCLLVPSKPTPWELRVP